MSFHFTAERKTNTLKLIRNYVKERVKEKQAIAKQFERLEAQLQNETIDQYTYERLRDVLEINFTKQRDEALQKAFFKHKMKM